MIASKYCFLEYFISICIHKIINCRGLMKKNMKYLPTGMAQTGFFIAFRPSNLNSAPPQKKKEKRGGKKDS